MKRLIFVALIFVSIMVMATTVVNAACAPAPTSGNDTIVCTGISSGGIDGDDGNDTITNEGTLSGSSSGDIRGGDGDDTLINNGTVDDEMRGGDGNDVIINNGYVDDDMHGDRGNDLLINNDFVEDDMRGDDGNDVLINNGYVDDEMRGDDGNDLLINNGIVNDEMLGGDGNDTLTNNGTVDDDIHGDSGNDTIINNGIVNDDLRGDSGNDLIINNGIVNSDASSTSDGILGGSGDDTIINNGVVTSNIFAGSGNDTVIIGNGAIVLGTINGGSDFDTLQFDVTACYETDGETIRATLSIPDLNPASDTVTLHGNTYTWVEFEELISTLFTQFCDGRHEIYDAATPLVSYCNIFNGLDIYDVNEIGVDGRSTEGLLTIRTTQLETREIVQLAVSTGVNQLIASDDYGNQLWALSSNELQIMGPEVTDPTKTYTFILPAGVCGIN